MKQIAMSDCYRFATKGNAMGLAVTMVRSSVRVRTENLARARVVVRVSVARSNSAPFHRAVTGYGSGYVTVTDLRVTGLRYVRPPYRGRNYVTTRTSGAPKS